MTSRLTLNSSEVSAILPGLETMLNGIATLRMGGQVDPFEFCRVNIHVDPNIRFDKEMSDHLLACRNKLKWLNPSRKVRLNSFEIAAAALALRVVRKLGL